jgi:hypothetical protein
LPSVLPCTTLAAPMGCDTYCCSTALLLGGCFHECGEKRIHSQWLFRNTKQRTGVHTDAVTNSKHAMNLERLRLKKPVFLQGCLTGFSVFCPDTTHIDDPQGPRPSRYRRGLHFIHIGRSGPQRSRRGPSQPPTNRAHGGLTTRPKNHTPNAQAAKAKRPSRETRRPKQKRHAGCDGRWEEGRTSAAGRC